MNEKVKFSELKEGDIVKNMKTGEKFIVKGRDKHFSKIVLIEDLEGGRDE